MARNNTIKYTIIGILVFFVLLDFSLRPYLRRRQVNKAMKTVMESWKGGDLLNAINLWEDKKKYPAIYDVKNYEVKSSTMKKINGVRYMEYVINITFTDTKILPSGKDWLLVFKNTHLGWRVSDFKLLK